MNKMIFANLVHRPFRTIISVVAVAVEVTLILLIVGLSIGMLNDAKNRQVGIGADIMVQPPGSSLLMGVSGAAGIETGAPLTPISSDEPGGCTMMSAPMPTWRFLASLSMPMERPTMSRIRVTSTATATTLMMVRNGRCTRLAKIILFMSPFDCIGCGGAPAWCDDRPAAAPLQ